ncbi:hypothetical protein [Paenibacillus agri]|uniref:Uncharacterized protein n=1 Tax=Paenibacillus agri TaxID=2744309 RepID=A0A850EQT1_9BACL|nr:hypothetical protein [Paenibacillus agri]NUU62130.1 hypothetical protein [Paenibacillus agri]
MMRDPRSEDFEAKEQEQVLVQESVDPRITASNAIKYTAYVMLLFGLLYFLAAYLGPML